MKDALSKLVETSHFYGNDKEFVIAGGGNTSYKDDATLWVKSSGVSLGDITVDGFVELDREKLQSVATGTFSEDSNERETQIKEALLSSRVYPEKNQRPSVEASLHEILEGRYVVHTHPTVLNGLLCSENAKAKAAELFGDEILYIPYIDPGYILFKRVQGDIDAYKARHGRSPHTILLENHGVFVHADTVEEIRERYDWLTSKTLEQVSAVPQIEAVDYDQAEIDALISSLSEQLGTLARFRIDSLIAGFCESEAEAAKVGYAFTPDIIVYCKSLPLFVKKADSAAATVDAILKGVAEYESERGYRPKVILLEGTGMVALEESEKSAAIVLDMFEDGMKISRYSESFGGPHFMNERERAFIENWEAESYRQKIAKQ